MFNLVYLTYEITRILVCRLDMRKKLWRLMPAFEELNRLETQSFDRRKPKSQPPIPCEKSILVAYGKYLYLFGGYGPAPEQFHNYPVEPIFEINPLSSWSDPQGWNANVYRFCVDTESWEWIKCKGQLPDPRAGNI